jgi:hypothetical protein
VCVCALVALAALAAPALAKAPSGKFHGTTEQKQNFTMQVTSKRLSYVTFTFECRKVQGVTGTVSLQDFPIKRKNGVYRFSLFAYGSMNYSDDQGYENGQVHMSGHFSKSGRAATGTFRVAAARCGKSGTIDWNARR